MFYEETSIVFLTPYLCVCFTDDCDSGYELTQTNGNRACSACSRGSYRNKVLHDTCQDCTNNKTTYTDMSVKEEDCIQGKIEGLKL